MPNFISGPHPLAPSGSTGNNTHTGIATARLAPLAVFHFVVEAVGGAPTVTFKFQGSVNGTDWFDIAYITDSTDTLAVATRNATAVGASIAFLANSASRGYSYYRCVTSANNNVTYRAELYLGDNS